MNSGVYVKTILRYRITLFRRPLALRLRRPGWMVYLLRLKNEGTDAKLGLRDFRTWRVQAIAWCAECSMSLLTKNVQGFTRLGGRAARVVTRKMSLDHLPQKRELPMLPSLLERACGGDSRQIT